MDNINRFILEKREFVVNLGNNSIEWYKQQSKIKKGLIILFFILAILALVTVLIFHKKLIYYMKELSDKWYNLRFGKLILFLLIFFVGFPPLIGFSSLSMLAGMIYGFPNGWPILASASVLGSFCSFIIFRYLLKNQAKVLVSSNEMFRAFSEILREDHSLFLLILIRMGPLPYSLSNGALAAIPELPAMTYFLASLITSPKLLIHVFIGYKMKELGDEKRSSSTKLIDLLTMLLTSLTSALLAYLIYVRMQRKLESYRESHGPNTQEGYDRIVFGNFDDDIELGNEVELTTADYDEDNFIIEDEEDLMIDGAAK